MIRVGRLQCPSASASALICLRCCIWRLSSALAPRGMVPSAFRQLGQGPLPHVTQRPPSLPGVGQIMFA